jgi:hypothetical protein
MNLEEAIRIAMKELGISDEDTQARINTANHYASPVGRLHEIKPGTERDAIDSFKAIFSATQSPEGQSLLRNELLRLEEKRKEN